ncbi:hypothetical protein IAE22_31530 [Bacillus sp. S34]|nr:hypothetical protein [Bacillus sp. S34]
MTRRVLRTHPEHWTGASWRAWRLEPDAVEFWHGSRDRMHRRLRYRLGPDGWSAARLQP